MSSKLPSQALFQNAPITLITLAALVLRLHGLGGQSLWSDEIGTVLVARMPLWKTFAFTAVNDVSPPLYYVFLHFWVLLCKSEFFLRLPSAIFGAAAVPLTFALARRICDKKAALLAGTLVAISPLAVYYSQELRYQTLLALLVLGSWYFLLRIIVNGNKQDKNVYAALLFFGFYTHLVFYFAAASQILFWLWKKRRNQIPVGSTFVRWPFFAAIPALALTGFQVLRGNADIRAMSNSRSIGSALADTVHGLFVGHSPFKTATCLPGLDQLLHANEPAFWWLVFFFASSFVFIAGASFLRASRDGHSELSFAFFIPLTILFLIHLFQPAVETKLLLCFSPFFFIALAHGLEHLRRSFAIAGFALMALLLTTMSLSTIQYKSDIRYHRPDWRGLAGYIESNQEPGDALLFFDFEMAYYYKGRAPLINPTALSMGFWSRPEAQKQLAASVDESLGKAISPKRIWLRLLTPSPLPWLNQLESRILSESEAIPLDEMPDFRVPVLLRSGSAKP